MQMLPPAIAEVNPIFERRVDRGSSFSFLGGTETPRACGDRDGDGRGHGSIASTRRRFVVQCVREMWP